MGDHHCCLALVHEERGHAHARTDTHGGDKEFGTSALSDSVASSLQVMKRLSKFGRRPKRIKDAYDLASTGSTKRMAKGDSTTAGQWSVSICASDSQARYQDTYPLGFTFS